MNEVIYFLVGEIIIGLIAYFMGKSKGYDNGWKNGMEAAERLGAFALSGRAE